MNENYSIVKDINGYRVIFMEHTMDANNYDGPWHATERAARDWAEETILLELKGRELMDAE